MQKITLDQVAFHGVPNILATIQNLKKMDVHGHLKDILPKMDATFQELSPRLMNQIAETSIYKRHIHTYLHFPSHDTAGQVHTLIHQVERHMNEKIIQAKRRDTKRRMTKEKIKVINFYKNNSEQLKLLFDLHNYFLKAQEKLSNV